MIKRKNDIFCVNFTGALLYSGTVYLYLFSLSVPLSVERLELKFTIHKVCCPVPIHGFPGLPVFDSGVSFFFFSTI